MNEQEQKTAKSIIGTLAFVIVYMIVSDLSLASLAVSYANPNLSAGPFDLWVMAVQVLAPVAAAYVLVTSKVGGGIVTLVTAIVAKVQSTTTESVPVTKYARADLTAAELKKVQTRLKALESDVERWKAEEADNV